MLVLLLFLTYRKKLTKKYKLLIFLQTRSSQMLNEYVSFGEISVPVQIHMYRRCLSSLTIDTLLNSCMVWYSIWW